MSEGIAEGWSVSLLGYIADIRFSNVDKKSDLENEIPVKLCNYMDVYAYVFFLQCTGYDSGRLNLM